MNSTTQPNVDPSEVERFNKLANEWWDPKGAMGPLHTLNPLRLTFIEQFCMLDNVQALDVGCGGGLLAEAMTRSGANVNALDVSEDLLQAAKQHAEQHGLNIQYHAQTIESFREDHAEQFDVVTCMEMLEHVPDPASIIQACADCCKPGGVVVFSTLNRNLSSFAKAIIGAEYILSLLPRGTHEYQKFIKPSELAHFARTASLELIQMQGIDYSAFSKSAKLSTDVSVNYLAAFRKP